MSSEGEERSRRGGFYSSSSSLRMETDDETDSDEEDILNVVNVVVDFSVTNSNSGSNHFKFQLTSTTHNNWNNHSEDVTTDDLNEGESVLDVVLSEQFREECHDIEDLAAAWITTYENARFDAFRAILELLLHSAGHMEALSREQAVKLDELTVETFDNWMSRPNVEPLILNNVFLKNVARFIQMTFIGGVCLDDMFLMRRVRCLLNVFNKSTWVSARYAALFLGALMALQYHSCWASLNHELRNGSVTRNESQITEQMELAKNFFEEFVIFVTSRTRDSFGTVRKYAHKIVFSWLLQNNKLLMREKYVHVVYNALLDDHASLRKLALQVFQFLYGSECAVREMEGILKRALPGVILRTGDENSNVAKTALKIVSEIYRRSPHLMENINLEQVFMLVFDVDEAMAHPATEFLHDVVVGMSTSNTNYLENTVLFVEECIAYAAKGANVNSLLHHLVDRLFPHAQNILTDWAAWKWLLLRNNSLDQSEKAKELACLLLLETIDFLSIYAGDRYFVDAQFPFAPSSDYLEKENDGEKETPKVDEKLKTECMNSLVRMTASLGPVLVELWDKYSDNQKGFARLLAIPLYFNGNIINSLDLKDLSSYLIFVTAKYCDTPTLDGAHRSLACLYHIMAALPQWRPFAFTLGNVMFKRVKIFLRACQRLNKKRLSKHREASSLRVIKLAFFLTRYFDVTNSNLLDDVNIALRYGTSIKNFKIICPTMKMSLYVLQWQLKHLIEGKMNADKRKSWLYKIQSQSRTLVIQLVEHITASNTFVRETAFSIMSRLFTMLCRHNLYVRDYKVIHLPKLSLETKEWLSFNLSRQVSNTAVPPDGKEYEMACEALQMFCSMLETQVMNMRYITSILCYFRFFDQQRNYNSILKKTIDTLSNSKSFPHVLIDCLAWMKTNTNDNVEKITNGLCVVTTLTEKVAVRIIGYGLAMIVKPQYHCVFRILAIFVKFLGKRTSRYMYLRASHTFRHLKEQEDFKVFEAALIAKQRIEDVEAQDDEEDARDSA